MNFEQYQKFVLQGVMLPEDTERERLMLAGMGLAGEAGEVCDEAKKVAFHGKDMDMDKMIKELGDVLWYFALMLDTKGITLQEVMETNVIKLCARYPHRHGDPMDVIADVPTSYKGDPEVPDYGGM